MATPTSSLGFPDILTLKAAQSLIADAPQSRPILGVDGTGEEISVDLDADSPHVLIQASVGGGKSVTGRSILAQGLAKGALGVILDVKRCSHRWAYNLPNVGYAKSIPEIGYALVELGKEVHRRNEIVENYPGEIEDAPVGPRIIVLAEELNATMRSLMELTKRIPKGSYNAMDALRDVLLLGRAAKVHIIGIIQFPDYRILDQSMTECFNTRIMIRYTKNAWVKIAWDAGMPQAAPPETGRGMVVYGGKARETQLLFLTEEQCAAMGRIVYALQNTPTASIGA